MHRHHFPNAMIRLAAIALATSLSAAAIAGTTPLGTAFTYQGQLKSGGNPYGGTADFQFVLFDGSGGGAAQVGAMLPISGVTVTAGVFIASLDFGQLPFVGDERWLQIAVRTPAGAGAFTTLAPRQRLTATPYALYALNVPNPSPFSFNGGNAVFTGGSVGIGTNIPLADLHVDGSASSAVGLTITQPGTSTGSLQVGSPAGQLGMAAFANNGHRRDIRFTDTGLSLSVINTSGLPSTANGLFVHESGNVGIGTVDPTSKLHVVGDVTATGFVQSLSPLLDSTVFLGWATDENGDDMARIRVGGNGTGAINGLDIQRVANVSLMRILNSGNVGLGTTLPATRLHLMGTMRSQSGTDTLDIDSDSINTAGNGFFGDPLMLNDSVAESVLIGFGGGNCGVGGGAAGLPLVRLHVDAGSDASLTNLTGGYFMIGAPNGANIVMDNNEIMARSDSVASTLYLNNEGGDVRIGQNGSASTVYVRVLAITGGSDLSESFDVASLDRQSPEPGMVVCIDPHNPGQLVPSTRAYDRTVAGVISGANGVKTGMIMGQQGSVADGEHPVALTGRVYVMCTAAAAITPGDLLTTSDVPGHAMRASDHARAQGAIIGKAMTALPAGESGMVLVLVSLQ